MIKLYTWNIQKWKWWNRKETVIFVINCSSSNRKRNWRLDSGICALNWAKTTKMVGNDSVIDGKWWTQRSSRRLSFHLTLFQNIIRRWRKIEERFGVNNNSDCKSELTVVTFYQGRSKDYGDPVYLYNCFKKWGPLWTMSKEIISLQFPKELNT